MSGSWYHRAAGLTFLLGVNACGPGQSTAHVRAPAHSESSSPPARLESRATAVITRTYTPPLPPSSVVESNEAWGRERVISRIGRLDECGRKADRRRDTSRDYILTVRFNEDGDAIQALLSPSAEPVLGECVDWQMREFARPGDRPPQRRTFRVHVPISFSPIGGRATPAPEQPFGEELITRD